MYALSELILHEHAGDFVAQNFAVIREEQDYPEIVMQVRLIVNLSNGSSRMDTHRIQDHAIGQLDVTILGRARRLGMKHLSSEDYQYFR